MARADGTVSPFSAGSVSTDPAVGFAPDDEIVRDEARIVSATCGGIRVASVYVPNGRSLDDEQYQFKLEWLGRLRAHLDAVCDATENVMVCGDFNIAPEDRDVWDPSAVHGATHVSEPERAALAELEAWGLVDVFRRHYEEGGLYSWWDYRAGNFHKHLGMRIDLMLATKPLAERSRWALIDRNARKGQSPSDHAPLVDSTSTWSPHDVHWRVAPRAIGAIDERRHPSDAPKSGDWQMRYGM